jgi:hypothetical protein
MAFKDADGNMFTNARGGVLLARCIDDRTTIKALAVETAQERAIEMGLGFLVQHNLTVANGVSNYLLLTTPADHLITLGDLSAIAIDGTHNRAFHGRIKIYEGATATGGSDTGVLITNYNRRSTVAAEFTVKGTPTVTAEGTELSESLISEERFFQTNTLQLKASTKYLIELYNESSVSADFTLTLVLYQIEA